MSRPKRPQLTVRIEYSDRRITREEYDHILNILADALADIAIEDARAEVAARLGITPDELPDRRESTHRRLRDELNDATGGTVRGRTRRR